jgi:hypothetical protein
MSKNKDNPPKKGETRYRDSSTGQFIAKATAARMPKSTWKKESASSNRPPIKNDDKGPRKK